MVEPSLESPKVYARKGGFECEFVEKPPSIVQTECPVCLQILREPHQVTCCGKSYCKVCIEKIKEKNEACPTCKEETIQDFPNKSLQQILYQFKVQCTHQKESCKWTGELGELDNHLNLDPQPANQLKGCQFATVKCRYSFAGCTTMIPRKDITVHMQESTQHHLDLLENKYNRTSKSLETVKRIIHNAFDTPPLILTMRNYHKLQTENDSTISYRGAGWPKWRSFDSNWESSRFYSHHFGYEMQLKVEVGIKKPLGVKVYMLKGNFDDQLKWGDDFTPMVLTVEVISQNSKVINVRNTIRIPDKGNYVSKTAGNSSRISPGTCESPACYIKSSEMYNYVKNDSLEFLISSIEFIKT